MQAGVPVQEGAAAPCTPSACADLAWTSEPQPALPARAWPPRAPPARCSSARGRPGRVQLARGRREQAYWPAQAWPCQVRLGCPTPGGARPGWSGQATASAAPSLASRRASVDALATPCPCCARTLSPALARLLQLPQASAPPSPAPPARRPVGRRCQGAGGPKTRPASHSTAATSSAPALWTPPSRRALLKQCQPRGRPAAPPSQPGRMPRARGA
mmetsp:Transcript_113072/g.365207  ORF Transcript_113072/g.365207 Transcript_113072/m.365207 type:complete len:216 (-) Transcript_113072:449-1096(-)